MSTRSLASRFDSGSSNRNEFRLAHDGAPHGHALVDTLAGDADLAAGDLFQSGDGVEQCRLAAAGGADQHKETAFLDAEVKPLQDPGRAEGFCETRSISRKDMVPQPFTAPAIRPRTK
jgi:hypothetical protein